MGLNGKADSLFSALKIVHFSWVTSYLGISLDTSPLGESESHFGNISALESNPLTSKFQLQ